MFRRFRTGFVPALLLTLLLIAAQALLLQHRSDLSQHAASDNCEWCLAHSPLTGALPSAGLPAPAAMTAVAPRAHTPTGRVRESITLYRSRAPPFPLSF